MKKIIISPDSFKGTMKTDEVCEIISCSIKQIFPDVELKKMPLADGGEGSVYAVLHAIGGKKVNIRTADYNGNPIDTFYGVMPDDSVIIEMAAAAGLPSDSRFLNPLGGTTYGVGRLMKHAIDAGHKTIYLGLGGSATNDGGCGAAAALGVNFFDVADKTFIPTGETLQKICRIDNSGYLAYANERGVKLVVLSDVTNPLCGDNGAARVFGPQKGANEKDVVHIDAGLNHLASIIQRDLKVDVLEIPGAGAAGGMGGGSIGLLGAQITSGIDTILNLYDFDQCLADADLVISGEGRFDMQSLQGKVISGLAKRTKKAGVPLILFVGDILDPVSAAYEMGITGVFTTNRKAEAFSASVRNSKENLRVTVYNLFHTIKQFV